MVEGADAVLAVDEDDVGDELDETEVDELPEPVDALEDEPDGLAELVVQSGHCGGEGTPAMPTNGFGKRPAALP